MSKNSKTLKIVLPLLFIAAAAAIAALLIMNKKKPPKAPHKQVGALVEVVAAAPQDYPLNIHASGTVEARQQISLEPQVSGRVVALGDGFAAGGFFRKGDLLLQIEPADYRLAVEQAEAALARAEVELATTESQAAIARLEWERLDLQQEEANPLTLYEPQLKNARANIASARASLEQARLNLRRTRLVAPFDSRIRSEQVDVGQFVRSGSPVATLVGTAAAEVVVSLPLDDLAWLTVPNGKAVDGSPAIVSFAAGGQAAEWRGAIERSLGEVDPRGRMLRVAVLVDDPYRLQAADTRAASLEVGMFVDVAFAGPVLKQKIVLPRRALRDNRTVWVADTEQKLRIRPVEILRLERESVVLESGLAAGEQVVLTTLSGAADGTQLRIAAAEEEK